MKTHIGATLALVTIFRVNCVPAELQEAADLHCRSWKGGYQMASGHEGTSSLEVNGAFYLTVPDEEHRTVYEGRVRTTSQEGDAVTFRCSIDKYSTTGEGFDGRWRNLDGTLDLAFETTLVSNDEACVLIGSMTGSGTMQHAKNFSGKIVLYSFHRP
ncbi:MAG: hypothetical protein HYY16_03370 [Planctomycetes bacterium]|nr:hypothetical protein [Planctomycetota bacterium]